MAEKQKPLKYEEILEDAFGFEEDAFKHNAHGEFSSRQRGKIKSSIENDIALFVGAAFIFILSLGYVGVTRSPLMMFALIFTVISLVGGLRLAKRWLSLRYDLNQNRIESIEGRIRLDVSGNSRSSSAYYLYIGDMKFTLDKKKFLALKNGDPYRIYYLPSSKRILSVEWLYSDESRDPAITENDQTQDLPNELVDDESAPFVDDFGAESRAAKRL